MLELQLKVLLDLVEIVELQLDGLEGDLVVVVGRVEVRPALEAHDAQRAHEKVAVGLELPLAVGRYQLAVGCQHVDRGALVAVQWWRLVRQAVEVLKLAKGDHAAVDAVSAEGVLAPDRIELEVDLGVLVHRPGTRATLGRVIHLPISICMSIWVSKRAEARNSRFRVLIKVNAQNVFGAKLSGV